MLRFLLLIHKKSSEATFAAICQKLPPAVSSLVASKQLLLFFLAFACELS